MHAVVRTYSGAGSKQLLDLLTERKAEVEGLLRAVPGLVSYTMVRTGDGGVTVTVCQDKAGTDESVKIAREWVQKNAAGTAASPPAVLEGPVVLQIK